VTAAAAAPVPELARVLARLAAHRPQVQPPHWAATALVLTQADAGPAVLLIRRVTREGDRWSGDMALPGGKADPGEDDPAVTAAREAWEETRIRVGTPVARLDDVVGRPAPGQRVATVVFAVDGRPDPVAAPAEVAETLWVPLAELADPANRGTHRYAGVVPFPAIRIGDRVIWGLTLGILEQLLGLLGPATRH
jgi:8-oxo-dGTP pyrophosphatase MutT (NUDIX family)